MAKVLVIYKPDRTIHKVNLANKAAYLETNSRLPAGQKWKFEEMEAEEAAKLPFIDKNYVGPAQAQEQLSVAQREVALLKKQLAEALKMKQPAAPPVNKGQFQKREPQEIKQP